MLRIYPVVLELIREVRPLVEALERRDADLARQCRRALCSVPLNLSEGSVSQGGNRRARYFNAAGVACASHFTCFETACAFGYLEPLPDATFDRFQHVLATLLLVWFAESDCAGLTDGPARVSFTGSRRRRRPGCRRPDRMRASPVDRDRSCSRTRLRFRSTPAPRAWIRARCSSERFGSCLGYGCLRRCSKERLQEHVCIAERDRDRADRAPRSKDENHE